MKEEIQSTDNNSGDDDDDVVLPVVVVQSPPGGGGGSGVHYTQIAHIDLELALLDQRCDPNASLVDLKARVTEVLKVVEDPEVGWAGTFEGQRLQLRCRLELASIAADFAQRSQSKTGCSSSTRTKGVSWKGGQIDIDID